jgi:ribose transport system ATP-binding protein
MQEGMIRVEGEYRLELTNISKHFGGVRALNKACMYVKHQEIHALVGENGAGKSTLLKVVSGAISRDEGEIKIDGQLVKISTPKEGKDAGIAIIYQELMLIPDLTIAENIFIDKLSSKNNFVNWKQLGINAKALLEQVGFGNLDPFEKVMNLSVAHQQIVEICKSIKEKVKVIIFDEPSAVLTFHEIEKLFEVIRKLKESGVSIIYVSHRLEEIFDLCDNVTVMRDGVVVNQLPTNQCDKRTLVNMMVGREMNVLFPKRNINIGEKVLEAKNLYATNVNDVSFDVRAGEILGFYGLVGSGRTETMRAIFGSDKLKSGEVIFLGKNVRFKSPHQAVKARLGLLPEDRRHQGILLSQSIRINTTLTSIKDTQNKLNLIDKKKEVNIVQNILEKLETKYGSMEHNVSSLSGGNQQKVSLSKWLLAKSKCIILDEPTRGVDVRAKMEIYKIINDLAINGIAVIMISSEMPEIIGICDRVVVMRQGAVVGEVQKADLSENNLIKLVMGM